MKYNTASSICIISYFFVQCSIIVNASNGLEKLGSRYVQVKIVDDRSVYNLYVVGEVCLSSGKKYIIQYYICKKSKPFQSQGN